VGERSLLEMLSDAGFVEARVHGWTGYRTSSCTQGALVSARKPAENRNEQEQSSWPPDPCPRAIMNDHQRGIN